MLGSAWGRLFDATDPGYGLLADDIPEVTIGVAPAHRGHGVGSALVAAQQRYWAGLATLIKAARPQLPEPECNERAADVDVIQNGMWLTALLGLDRNSMDRAVGLCEAIALSS